MSDRLDLDPRSLKYDDRGLLPVIAQDEASGAVLMLAYADHEAVEKTVATGQAHFWSRSRRELWHKGATSGNTLDVVEALADCDRDALLLRVRPAGPACHRGTRSCFEPNPARFELGWLWRVLEERRASGDDSSYTARLLAKGLPRVAQKVGEEATETVIAALTAAAAGAADGVVDEGGANEELVGEASDLVYHLLVLLLASGVEPDAVAAELAGRHAARSAPPAVREASGEAAGEPS